MENVLTSQTLWEGYDPTAEQLDTVLIRQNEEDGVVSKQLYFTGRTLEHGKSRIYATVCYEGNSRNKPAVFVIGDYRRPIEEDVLRDFARRGFVAMSVDFAGRRDEGLCTLYPEQLDYCNADVAGSMFDVTSSARETALYEYALNCRRAITYLLDEEKVDCVSVLTSLRGVCVGIIVLGVENRVKNGVLLFGNIYRNYPEPDKDENMLGMDQDELERHIAYDTKKHKWALGLAPQTYALQIKIPLYVINSANSPYVDVAETSKTIYRVNAESRLLILPTCMDYLPARYTDDVIRWLKGFVAKPKSEIKSFVDESGDYCVRVLTTRPIEQTSVWYCTDAEGSARYWTKANLVSTDNGYVAKLNLFEKQCTVAFFALFEDDVTVSTPLVTERVSASNVRKAVNIIFSGAGNQTLIPLAPRKVWWNVNLEPELAKGHLNLVGAKGKVLATFAISDKSIHIDSAFTLGFDVCCKAKQQIKITAVKKFGSLNQLYSQTAEVVGTGKWERLTFDKANFHRNDDGRQLTDEEKVDLLIISAENEFIVNNIFLV